MKMFSVSKLDYAIAINELKTSKCAIIDKWGF